MVLLLATCSPTPIPPATLDDAFGNDAYHGDGGVITIYPDMGQDLGVMDAPDMNLDMDLPDMNLPDMNLPDTSSGSAIVVDGVLNDPFWMANALNPPLTNAAMGIDPFMGDALTTFVYGRDDEYLYFGFEGALTVGDAIVVYVDVNAPGTGVMLVGTGLEDMSNPVNAVASLMITGNALFEPDFVFGTSTLPGPGSSVVYSSALGWRRLAMVGSFSPISSNTVSACSSTGCETQIAWPSLGVSSGGPIQLVARLGRPTVGFDVNQLFPTDDTGAPEMISATISVSP